MIKLLPSHPKSISLAHLVCVGLVCVGDEFYYQRTFKSINTMVRHSGVVVGFDGRRVKVCIRNSSSSSSSDTATTTTTTVWIDHPSQLENAILDLDTRIMKRRERPNGNSWKCIHLVRDGVELGKLYCIRQLLFTLMS